MNVIVFSKDRAMQLDAFLRSYQDHVFPLVPVCVLKLATTQRDGLAYGEVFAQYPWATNVDEGDFKTDVLRLLPADGNVAFFVDDMVFLRRWDVLEWPGLSLRLGLNLTHDYNSNDAMQPLPNFCGEGDGFVSWRWDEGQYAWCYPMSLDGHVYDAGEVRRMVGFLNFRSPNTLESALHAYTLTHPLHERGLCYRESKVVNVPWNQVQTDWHNRHGNHDADALLLYWEAGKRIDVCSMYGTVNTSVHQEFPLVLEARR